jgi:hypothetical protein
MNNNTRKLKFKSLPWLSILKVYWAVVLNLLATVLVVYGVILIIQH